MARDNILGDSSEDWPRDGWVGRSKPAALTLIMRTALRRDIPAIGSLFLFTIGYCNPRFRKRSQRVSISKGHPRCRRRKLNEEINIDEEESVEREMAAFAIVNMAPMKLSSSLSSFWQFLRNWRLRDT